MSRSIQVGPAYAKVNELLIIIKRGILQISDGFLTVKHIDLRCIDYIRIVASSFCTLKNYLLILFTVLSVYASCTTLMIISLPLTSTWLHVNSDVGLEEGEY